MLKGISVCIGPELLKSFCVYVMDMCGEPHVITANEVGACGLAVGH